MPRQFLSFYRFIQESEETPPGYFVVSKSSINEDLDSEPPPPNEEIFISNKSLSQIDVMKEIAEYLNRHDQPEIVIGIHGYSSRFSDVQKWYRDMYCYLDSNASIHQKQGTVFIAFRWPSENPFGDESGSWFGKLKQAIKSFPVFPSILLIVVPTSLSLSLLIIPWTSSQFFIWVMGFVIIFSTSILSTLMSLMILRLTAYFRDSYRAINVAIPDLAELLTGIDIALRNDSEDRDDWGRWGGGGSRVKVSFIAHSMGCFIATNVLDLLTDKFDSQSATQGRFGESSYLGNCFIAGRLVLIAPDVPAEVTFSRRRRGPFERSLQIYDETYIFTNEGDIVLRLASTLANYFSYPVSKRAHGYRLGNVGLKIKDSRYNKYGAVNIIDNRPDNPFSYLEIRTPWGVIEPGGVIEPKKSIIDRKAQAINLVTFFDCTDYKDNLINNDKAGKVGVVTNALSKRRLGFFDYLFLLRKNTHGGYFKGQFCRSIIYGFAFFGFDEVIQSIAPQEENRSMQINLLSRECEKFQIRFAISPRLSTGQKLAE